MFSVIPKYKRLELASLAHPKLGMIYIETCFDLVGGSSEGSPVLVAWSYADEGSTNRKQRRAVRLRGAGPMIYTHAQSERRAAP